MAKQIMKYGLMGIASLFLGTTLLTSCTEPKQKTSTLTVIVNTIDENCVSSKFEYLGLDIHTFDQDKAKGWRSIADKEDCLLSAAALLNEYRTIVMAENLSSLTWHEAQLRANAGETEQAIFLFKQTHTTQGKSLSNIYYRDATIAFLRRDKKLLVIARNLLANIPEPKEFANAVARFKKQYPDYPPPIWPSNLDVVDGFIACFEKPYKEAYKLACRN